ncbi:MAG: DUF368 domain-containing protein [Bacteroidetes bacterium]|nr:DUF368 domain-containing protein [Bacteroidota bacterium]MCB9227748.1 DUF368 domain-containing protein [Chitinophagales bacterium]
MIKYVTLALKGMAMGMAEVVPGVSGGTIAFITGIYEELLNTIKGLTPKKLLLLKNEGFASFWKAINGNFLLGLFAGMLMGLVVGVLVISHLLETQPILVWSFFFGLIAASVIYVARQIEKWTLTEIVLLILTTALSYYITIASPSQGPQQLWFVFLAGFIAICALMLPGVSGSFLLLLMGMYQYIVTDNVKALISNFNTESLVVVLVFGLGCLAGVLTFSRVLSWTFKNYRTPTLAALTGFLIGSLNKVWPWKQVLTTRINSHGEEIAVQTKSILPSSFAGEPQVVMAVLMMVVGFVLILAMDKMSNKKVE